MTRAVFVLLLLLAGCTDTERPADPSPAPAVPSPPASWDLDSDVGLLVHGAHTYEDGILTVDYSYGHELQKDVSLSKGVVTEGKHRHCIFEGRRNVGYFPRAGDSPAQLEEEDDDEDEDESKPFPEYSFAANTKGQLAIDLRFKNKLKVEFDVSFQLVLPDNPRFQVLVNSDKRSNYYGVTFGSHLECSTEKKTPMVDVTKNPKFPVKKHYKDWVDRTKPYHYKIVYLKNDGAKAGTLRVMVNDEVTFETEASKYDAGFVCFRWVNVKFVVYNLKIKGQLDHEWALEELERRRR